MATKRISDAGKEELALALMLWKDFKCDGRFDTDLILQMYQMADYLGIKSEVEAMSAKLPPMKIEPRVP